MATGYLGVPENAFWKMTPREFYARLNVWQEIEKGKRDDLAFKIAAWMNGQNPNTLLEKNKPMTPDQVFEAL